MKILLIHNYFNRSKNVGGEDMVFKTEQEALTERLGSDHVFVMTDTNESASLFSIVCNMFFSFKCFFKVYRLVKKHKIELVHVHNFFPLISPSVFVAARLAGARTVQSLHNYRWSCIAGTFYRKQHGVCMKCNGRLMPWQGIKYRCYRNSRLQSFVTQFAHSLYKLTGMMNSIEFAFVLSPFQKAMLAGNNALRNTHIVLKPNFIEELAEMSEKRNFEHDLIYVGRFDESKGFSLLLDAYRNSGTKFRLSVFGTGDMLDMMDDSVRPEGVTYFGMLPNDEILRHIRKARYLIQPSILFETFGLTILEAFGCCVPVIGIDVGTRKDFIQDGKNGFLAADVEELSRLFHSLPCLPDAEYQKLAAEARNTYNRFRKTRAVDFQLDVYKKILNNETIDHNDFFQ